MGSPGSRRDYDQFTNGSIVSEDFVKSQNANLWNNSMKLIPTGNIAADGSPEYEIQQDGNLRVIGQDGNLVEVSQGFGLGIRQHDDIMLAFGYSRKTTKKFTLPAGEFVAITLDVGSALTLHHAENRYVGTYNGNLDFKVIVGKTISDMTGTPSRMSAFNQNGATLDPAVQSLFDYYPPSAVNPVGGVINEANTIDELTIYSATGQGVRVSSSNEFSTVQGRHYSPGDFIVALFENVSDADIVVEYVYAWHEF